jgi:hypothetical protein
MKIGCPLFDRDSCQCNGPWEGSFNDGTTQTARGLPFGQPARTKIEAGPLRLGWESGSRPGLGYHIYLSDTDSGSGQGPRVYCLSASRHERRADGTAMRQRGRTLPGP